MNADMKLLVERIKNLNVGLLGMTENATMQVSKSFLTSIRDYMMELSMLKELQPLTLDELRGLEEPTPIWIVDLWGDTVPHWELVQWETICACPLDMKLHCVSLYGDEDFVDLDNYGDTWIAYRNKPFPAVQGKSNPS